MDDLKHSSQEEIDLFYMRMAYRAALVSPDPSTQNGAVIVNRDGELVFSCNKFAHGVAVTTERLERPLKYEYIGHAERNVIYRAAMRGTATGGATMYVPWFACSACAIAIIQAGIIEVVGHNLPEHEDNPRWKESIRTAMGMLEESGVRTRYLEGSIGKVAPILMNGKLVTP